MAGRQINKCPHCNLLILPPRGPIKADILAIGDWPDWLDIKKGTVFHTGGWRKRVGDVLHNEFQNAGINPGSVRYANVWQHAVNKECSSGYHKTELYKEILNRRFLLLMGTETLQLFLPDAKIAEWSGLEILSPELPKDCRAFACVKPSMALGDTLGEVRFAIQEFAELVHGQ